MSDLAPNEMRHALDYAVESYHREKEDRRHAERQRDEARAALSKAVAQASVCIKRRDELAGCLREVLTALEHGRFVLASTDPVDLADFAMSMTRYRAALLRCDPNTTEKTICA